MSSNKTALQMLLATYFDDCRNAYCFVQISLLTLFTPMKKVSESLGSGGGSGSPPRRLTLAVPLVVCCIASLPSRIAGSLSFQLKIKRAVLAYRTISVIQQLPSVLSNQNIILNYLYKICILPPEDDFPLQSYKTKKNKIIP